jgi:hypothetical protein
LLIDATGAEDHLCRSLEMLEIGADRLALRAGGEVSLQAARALAIGAVAGTCNCFSAGDVRACITRPCAACRRQARQTVRHRAWRSAASWTTAVIWRCGPAPAT